MKKFFVVVVFMMVLCGCAFGASEDVYATKTDIQELRNDIRALSGKIDAMNTRLNDFQTYTAGQFQAVNQRIDDLQASMHDNFEIILYSIGWGIGGLGIFIAVVAVVLAVLTLKRSETAKERQETDAAKSTLLKDALELMKFTRDTVRQ